MAIELQRMRLAALRSQLGLAPGTRACMVADAAVGDPSAAPALIEAAIVAALTDYRRAFARLVVDEGGTWPVVWRAMGRLAPTEAVPPALAAPLAPADVA